MDQKQQKRMINWRHFMILLLTVVKCWIFWHSWDSKVTVEDVLVIFEVVLTHLESVFLREERRCWIWSQLFWRVSDPRAQFLFLWLPWSACHSVSWKQTLTLYNIIIMIGCIIFLTLTFGLLMIITCDCFICVFELAKRKTIVIC